MENINFKEKSTQCSGPLLCFCKSITPTLYVFRLFGLFPLGINHSHQKCQFYLSKIWLTYSLIVLFSLVVTLIWTTNIRDFENMFRGKPLLLVLSSITDMLYGVYLILIILLNCWRFPKYLKTLNDIVPLVNEEGLLCQSALRAIRKTQFGIVALMTLLGLSYIFVLFFILFYMPEHFDYKNYIDRSLQIFTFMFNAIFYTYAYVIIGALGCFQKMTMYLLKYKPTNPLHELADESNTNDFIGIIQYRICSEKHSGYAGRSIHLSQVQLIEHLRCLHEEICLVMYNMNAAMNPQFLLHSSIELTVLIVDWYAVIIYYTFHTWSIHSSVHYMNVWYVILHTFGIWCLLKTANKLKTMISALEHYLLEFSTRANSVGEHQQIRLFLDKLKMHRPLTASGIFTIDLSIAGPISANILTYVLVALQFDAK